ncbi:major latex protein 15-like [Papaver somniferum]|uniref:major latex protein 15-like n=1 Tax=Papaver somniferum TaxID=3469 RepID=UPI000E6F7A25|nr:major latex protein 15-like [Papaver somniferum]
MAHPHGISILSGKLTTESHVDCDANSFYQIYKQHVDVPKAIPHIFRYVKVVEGDGTKSGCIKEWGFHCEGKELFAKESTTYTDETRTICHSVIEGDLMNVYKRFNGTLMVKVKPIGYGSIVSWTVDYELINKDSPVPFDYVTMFSRVIEGLDAYLCASG